MPFLIPRWAAAQVLVPRRIFVRRDTQLTRRLLAHELVHVEQLKSMGILRYWWCYLVLLMRCGYREHPMELDAIVRAAEPFFLDWAAALLAVTERERTSAARLSPQRPVDFS
ncbi:MAG: hypothetical protein WD273_08915 [Trueperaceae bacterium]